MDRAEKMRATSKYEHDLSNRGDKFVFKYPRNHIDLVWNNITNTNSLNSHDLTFDTSENEIMSEKKPLSNIFFIMVFPYTSHTEKSSENTLFIEKKVDWKISNSFQSTTASYESKKYNNLVCCIIPLQNNSDIFVPQTPDPGEFEKIYRLKRSNKEDQKQRNVLLKRRYPHQIPTDNSETKDKIVTPDYEYDDPYWNIRSAKWPKKQRPESSTIYNVEDYIENYDVELPRPGLTGIYSDNGKPLPGWAFSNTNDGPIYDDVEDDDDNLSNFGYSTVDPRIESPTRISKSSIKPIRVTTASQEPSFDAESHTISYHSNPDFNVLQDFKLLHLIRNKNKAIIKPQPTTTKVISDSDSKESILNDPLEDISTENEDFQIAKNCGQIAMPVALRFQGRQIGYTENGSHPWLAVLIPRRNMKKILCYATLIHKRAAITAADCARTSEGDLTLIAGIWNYNERSRMKSRSVSTLLHPQFKSGELNNNLALIHWQRPLKLEVNVHPVCINKPHVGDNCIFVGWGGFDQVLRNRSRWQRAAVHTCKDHLSLNGVNIPNEAFCASVRSPTTVTGLGGSLVCNVNDRVSAIGVAVSRDSTLVLLPIYDWVIQVIDVINE